MVQKHLSYSLKNEHAVRLDYDYDEKTKNGETLQVCFTKATCPEAWHKEHLVPSNMKHYWSVNCYFTNDRNECYEAYNPTVSVSSWEDERGHSHYRPQLNFDWVLDATDENIEKILNDIEDKCFGGE